MYGPQLEISLVIPTLNERQNIPPLLSVINEALKDKSWEVIFVDDDSQDGTADYLSDLSSKDPRIRSLIRKERSGLSSACVEGMKLAQAPLLGVMDADLQHDARVLPQMIQLLEEKKLDLVVGSRYAAHGGIQEWAFYRRWASQFATRLVYFFTDQKISDPLSGFFVVRKSLFETVAPRLYGKGFKILHDIVSSTPKGTRIGEVPYTFQPRRHGESKLGLSVMLNFLIQVISKSEKFHRKERPSKESERLTPK